jgi:hypothetical protein
MDSLYTVKVYRAKHNEISDNQGALFLLEFYIIK